MLSAVWPSRKAYTIEVERHPRVPHPVDALTLLNIGLLCHGVLPLFPINHHSGSFAVGVHQQPAEPLLTSQRSISYLPVTAHGQEHYWASALGEGLLGCMGC